MLFLFFFKQKTAYEMRISDWSSDVCSSDLIAPASRRCSGSVRPSPARSVRRHGGSSASHRSDGSGDRRSRSEEHTSELQSLMRISYAVFCLKKKKKKDNTLNTIMK